MALGIATATPILAQGPGCPGWRDPVGKKIVGGDPTSTKLWPSQAALRLTSPGGQRTIFICGGTAVATDSVMTAAHCFDDIEQQADGHYLSTDKGLQTIGWRLDLVLGVDDLDDAESANSYPVATVLIREGYVKGKAESSGYDMALIRLARRWSGPLATLSLDIASDPPDAFGAALTVAGFGLLKGRPEGGTMQTHKRSDGTTIAAGSRKLRQVVVPMVPTDKCAAMWMLAMPPALVGSGQLCAGYESVPDMSKWKDSCGGDSGGPIVHYDQRGCPTHVGLVSWGAESCGTPKAYGVYTRLSHHAAWLSQHVPGALASPVVASSATIFSTDMTAIEFVAQATNAIGGSRGTARIAVEGGATVKNEKVYRFSVTSEVAGRLVILDVNAEGVVTQLFPNEFVLRDDLSLVRAGETITVPGTAWGVLFRAGPPFGKGLIIALVVPPDFPVHLLVTAPQRTKGFTAERSAVGYLMNLLQQIAAHATGRSATAAGAGSAWAIATYEYEVVP